MFRCSELGSVATGLGKPRVLPLGRVVDRWLTLERELGRVLSGNLVLLRIHSQAGDVFGMLRWSRVGRTTCVCSLCHGWFLLLMKVEQMWFEFKMHYCYRSW